MNAIAAPRFNEELERARISSKLRQAESLIWEAWRADPTASDELELRRAIGILRSAQMNRAAREFDKS